MLLQRGIICNAIDFEKAPPMFQISETHFATHGYLHQDAPKVEPPESVKQRIRKLSSNFESPIIVGEGK